MSFQIILLSNKKIICEYMDGLKHLQICQTIGIILKSVNIPCILNKQKVYLIWFAACKRGVNKIT